MSDPALQTNDKSLGIEGFDWSHICRKGMGCPDKDGKCVNIHLSAKTYAVIAPAIEASKRLSGSPAGAKAKAKRRPTPTKQEHS